MKQGVDWLWSSATATRLKRRSPAFHHQIRERALEAVATMRQAARNQDLSERINGARRALMLLMEAFTASRSEHDIWPSFEQAMAFVAGRPGAVRHHHAIASLASHQLIPTPEQYRTLAAMFGWLEHQVDVRAERELFVARAFRIGLVMAVLAVGYQRYFGTTNLARGRRVMASSSCPLMPPPSGDEPFSRLVDGIRRERSFAVCTGIEPHPSLVIDLGALHRIEEVVVAGRNDCCWGDQELPLAIELSKDGKRYQRYGVRTTPFSAEFPYHLALPQVEARTVRLTSPAPIARQLVLSEVEIYGR